MIRKYTQHIKTWDQVQKTALGLMTRNTPGSGPMYQGSMAGETRQGAQECVADVCSPYLQMASSSMPERFQPSHGLLEQAADHWRHGRQRLCSLFNHCRVCQARGAKKRVAGCGGGKGRGKVCGDSQSSCQYSCFLSGPWVLHLILVKKKMEFGQSNVCFSLLLCDCVSHSEIRIQFKKF